ncbi:class I SAM-dependent DNA methyltransferase [Actinophytocola sediminis]
MDPFQAHPDTYARWAERGPVNAHYDRPAILRLAGDLRGKRVLELGCAGGSLTELLVDRGADVLGVDREPRLVEVARQRLGDRARFEVADLARPLTMVSTGGVDVVVASLVLHYLEDWTPLLTELHRCLTPGGALVFSVHHPITGWLLSDRTDYHRTELITEDWDWGERWVTATMYRRPLSRIFGDLRTAGFTVDVVDEPRPEPNQDIPDEVAGILATQPVFLFLRAVR